MSATAERDLWAYLTAQPALAPLVGDRVYAIEPPADPVYPAIVYQVTDGENFDSNEGPGELNALSIALHVLDTDYLRMKLIRSILKTLLGGFRGVMGDTHVHLIALGHDRAEYQDVWLGARTGLYHQAVEIELFYFS